jgi:hypothetical protein
VQVSDYEPCCERCEYLTLFAEKSDFEAMKGGRGGGSLSLRMQLERMELVSHAGYAADAPKQMNAASVQPHAPLNRSPSVGAAMSVPSLSFPAQSQQQQQQTNISPASLPVRLPGTQFVV